MEIHRCLLLVVAIAGLTLGGCDTQQASSLSSTTPSESVSSSVPVTQATTATFNDLPKLQGKATVVMTVNDQPITIEVDGTKAPISAGNFVDLVQRGVYNRLAFHRVVRQPQPFVVQGGDPQSKDPKVPVEQLGTGGFTDPATKAERYIPLEITPSGAATPIYSQTLKTAGISESPSLQHKRGAVAMARSQSPDSASSQFYFTLADLGFLDGDYAVFGYVTDGMKVVDKIQQGDRIQSAKVTKGIENLKTPN